MEYLLGLDGKGKKSRKAVLSDCSDVQKSAKECVQVRTFTVQGRERERLREAINLPSVFPQKVKSTGRPPLKMMQKQISAWRNPGTLTRVLQPFSCTDEKDIGGSVAVEETSFGGKTLVLEHID